MSGATHAVGCANNLSYVVAPMNMRIGRDRKNLGGVRIHNRTEGAVCASCTESIGMLEKVYRYNRSGKIVHLECVRAADAKKN